MRRLVTLCALLALVSLAPAAFAQAPPTTAPAATATTAAPATTAVPQGESPAAPTVTVTPDSGLVDGQAVQVDGQNFFASDGYAISECGYNVSPQDFDCIVVGHATAVDDQGHVEGQAVVRARFTGDGGQLIDCYLGQCNLNMTEVRGAGGSANIYFGGVIAASPGFTG